MNEIIKGPFAVLMTPFFKGEVDENAYIKQVERLNKSKISGYVTNGSTGEFTHLSLEEQMKISALVAKNKSKDKKLIVSACTANAVDTITLCRHAKEIGADAVLVCPPYYFKYTKKEREEYFIKVATSSPVPVVLYNIPFFTQELELDVIYRVLEHENIIGIKDSSANMKRLEHLVEVNYEKEVSILTGTDDILLPALVGGCVGSMTAFAAIYPDEICGIYNAVRNGDLETARKIQFSLMPKLRKADLETFPKGYKRLYEEVTGIMFGDKGGE